MTFSPNILFNLFICIYIYIYICMYLLRIGSVVVLYYIIMYVLLSYVGGIRIYLSFYLSLNKVYAYPYYKDTHRLLYYE